MKGEGSMEQENKMGIVPVRKLLLSIALPIMISMSVQSLYTMVDSMFVSRLGEAALTATSLGLPVMTIVTAVANGIAVGTNAMLSKALGERNQKDAENAIKTSLFIIFVSYLLAAAASMTVVELYLRTQTNDSHIISLGTTYLKICVGLSLGIFGQTIFERFLISTGKTTLSMITQATGAVINIILDPVFIFGYFGVPAMDIAGAAFATVIGQCIAFILALVFNFCYNKEIRIKIGQPNWLAAKQILSVGIPTSVMQVLTAIMFILFNMILASFTTTAVAVFGVCRSITAFFYTLANGMCSAVVPVLAYNYGAKNKKRIKETMKYGYIYVTVIMAFGTVLFLSLPEFFLSLFNANEQMMAIGIIGVRMFTCSFIFAGIRLMSTTMMQSLGHGVNGMIVSITREFGVLIPVAYLFSRLNNLTMVWASAPMGDMVSSCLALLLLRRVYKKEIEPLDESFEGALPKEMR